MRIVVNWPLCDGNGVCALEAPEAFALDDEDNLIVVREEFGADIQSKVESAVRVCPKHALRIEQD